MTKIYIIGLTGESKIGGYEKQLGNVAVLIPMIKLLKSHIPDANISTTIQLTDNFCKTHGITRIPNPKRLLPRFDGGRRLLVSVIDLFRASLWRSLKNLLRIDVKILRRGEKLERFFNSKIILDFNGDVFPSDGAFIRVLILSLHILTIRPVSYTHLRAHET